MYDVVFDYATSMKSEKFQFSYDDRDYILWAWKGDYLNMGAGAELGIYSNESGIAGKIDVSSPYYGIWLVDTSLSMQMSLTLYDKNGNTIFDYSPTEEQWWITGFAPFEQNVMANDLTAVYTVKFDDEGMFESFKNGNSERAGVSVNDDTMTITIRF